MLEMLISLTMLSLKGKYLLYSLFFLCFIFVLNYKWVYEINYFGADSMSWFLMMLSIWIICLSIMATKYSHKLMTLTLMLLYICFNSSGLMMFYITFEVVSIPLYLMIMWHGFSPERLESMVYMLFYTMFGSIPLLLSIVPLLSMEMNYMYLSMSKFMMMSNLAFMVKLPMYGLHFWLPKAHVEAPVNGSMILAGVLLKLGGYGLIRGLSMSDIPTNFIMSIGVWGAIVMSFSCMREIDLKKLVAFSSVHHMGFLVAGVSTKSVWGVNGSIAMMISHGLFSSGMFYMVNLMYIRMNTRNLIMIKGMLNLNPSLVLMWFISILGNMGGPPLMGFIAEVLLLISVMMWWFMFPVSIMLFMSVAYSIHLYLTVTHGKPMSGVFEPIMLQEIMVIMLHLLPSLMLLFKMELL